jgi:putative membrane protein
MKPGRRLLKNGITSAFVLLFVVFTAAAYAQDYPGSRHMWGDWGSGNMIFGSLMMVLFMIGIIVVFVLLFRRVEGGSTKAPALFSVGNTALDILKERFAHGEIDKEEFEDRKHLLSD